MYYRYTAYQRYTVYNILQIHNIHYITDIPEEKLSHKMLERPEKYHFENAQKSKLDDLLAKIACIFHSKLRPIFVFAVLGFYSEPYECPQS